MLSHACRECEEIHLGKYDHLITEDRDEFLPRILEQSAFARELAAAGNDDHAGLNLLQREARRRWNRVMTQPDASTMHWTQQQVQRIRQGMRVAASPEADDGSLRDLLLIRRTSSRW